MISASLVKELREKSGAGMLDCKKALEATNGNIDEAIDWLREKGISKAAKKADRIAAEGLASIMIDGNKAAIVEVNSETDFVAKNEEFKSLVSTILKTILNSNASTVEELLEEKAFGTEETVNELIISKTATIGEKLSLRRFAKIEKTDSESFGEYIHMGGRIAVLTLVDNASSEVAKDVAMHAAAMRPIYVKSSNVPTDVLEKEKTIMREQLLNEGKPEDKIDAILVGKVKKYYEEVCLENQIFVKAENKETVGQFVQNNGGTIVNMIRFEVGEGMEKKEENFAEEVAKQING
ncbi:MAG: translation elongation factor Ts [Tenericutes bacterium]|nr:translation elongation factor Ts [Mycoplasmatota bacterium]